MSAPDFTSFLSKPAGEAVKPPPLPGGDYQAVLKSYDTSIRSREKKTPGIQFVFTLIGWPDEVEEDEKTGIDLATRTARFTQYVTEDSAWRLDELLRDHMGLDVKGKSYDEILAEAVGTQVTVSMVQQISQSGASAGDTITVCDKIGPAN